MICKGVYIFGVEHTPTQTLWTNNGLRNRLYRFEIQKEKKTLISDRNGEQFLDG